MYYLYILQSEKRRYSYVGTTDNLERRLFQHNNGKSKATKPYRPFLLVHKEEFITLAEARKKEWFYKCTPQGGKLKRKILMMAGVAA
jgi:putative endonuclease